MYDVIEQGSAFRVMLKAYNTSDGSAATGKTIAVVISKNGGSFANPAAGVTNATEVSNGWYYADLGTSDTGTLGPLVVRGTATGVDDVEPPPFLVGRPSAVYYGTVTGSPTTTSFIDTALPTRPNDTWKGRIILIDTGTCANCGTDIKTYVDSTKTLTFTSIPSGLTVGDKYRIT